MALITRCPVCGTLFKVVPDQLRISEGWVRCGQCAEVFDASGDLQQSDLDNPQLLHLAEAPPPPADISVPAPEPAWVPAPEPYWQAAAELASPMPPELESATWVEPALLQDPAIALPLETDQEPEPVAEVPATPDLAAPIAESPASVAEDMPSDLDAHEPEPLPIAEATGYSFIATPEPIEPTRRAWVRWLWGGASGLLLVVLGLQALIVERDRIAAMWPTTKPGLQAVCAQLGCSIQAWRQIESIVIDSSTLGTVQNGEAYRLNLVLKNLSMVDLSMPAIEFVLTDIDEQAVFRRVLTPTELGAASRVLFAGREWVTSVDLRVTDGPSKARVVGYRLLAFYP